MAALIRLRFQGKIQSFPLAGGQFSVLLHLQATPGSDEHFLDFGRHKGKHISTVDVRYLQWMLESFSQSSRWWKAAADTLAARGKKPERATHDLLQELKTCRNLQLGKSLHEKATALCKKSDMYILNGIINMYRNCGSMVDARCLFDSIEKPNVIQWNTLILGYAENREPNVAVEMFTMMKERGCSPNSFTYVAVLKACTGLITSADGNAKKNCLEKGIKIHLEIGYHLDQHIQGTLVDMYSKCGSMALAREVFDSIEKPDVVSWTALLLGYAENGEGYVALDLFSRMKSSGYTPNSVTYMAAVKACTSLALNGDCKGCLDRGREIHSDIDCNLNINLQNALMEMYVKAGSIVEAHKVFDNIQNPDVMSWNTLIFGYSDNEKANASLGLFSLMKTRGCAPNDFTYFSVLKACTALADGADSRKDCLKLGRKIHSELGCRLNPFLENALIGLYSKCGEMVDARNVFDGMKQPDVVSWTTLLLGYADNNEGYMALDMFLRMKTTGITPNDVTYIAVLKACTSIAVHNGYGTGKRDCLEYGRKIHSEIGCHTNPYVQGTLVDMYSKCGSMLEARRVFDSIQNPDLVSWTSLLSGYTDNGEGHVALDLFSMMKAQGCIPSSVTYAVAIKACGLIGELTLGRKIHSEIQEFTPQVLTSLIDFYAKCGSIVDAREVFDLHENARNVRTWTALIRGYSKIGDPHSVFKLFEAMKGEGVRPDGVTFACLLLCCSHAGLVENARAYFEAMPVQYGVAHTITHYTCMVDALGRANQLDEAVGMIRRMPCSPNAGTWTTLLGACHKWKNVEIGREAFQALLEIDNKNGFPYVLMADIYARMEMWEEQEKVLQMRTRIGAWKLPGREYLSNEFPIDLCYSFP